MQQFRFVLSGNFWNKPLCWGGICSSEPRQFSNGLPWVLSIFLGDLEQTRHTNLMDLKKSQNVFRYWTPDTNLEQSHSGMEFTTRVNYIIMTGGMVTMACMVNSSGGNQ